MGENRQHIDFRCAWHNGLAQCLGSGICHRSDHQTSDLIGGQVRLRRAAFIDLVQEFGVPRWAIGAVVVEPAPSGAPLTAQLQKKPGPVLSSSGTGMAADHV